MSSDPHVEKSDEKGDDRQSDRNVDEDDERNEQPQPAFQRVADEIGRRFRKALDRLA